MKNMIISAIAGAVFLVAGAACAATPESKALFKQSKDRAEAEYKAARARCDVIAGNPKDICVAEAKAARVRTVEEANALYKNTLKAYTASRLKVADAYFDVDKAKCAAVTGNARDVCVQRAKATLIAAQADAKADKKSIEARSDARDDKREAEYKVARQKCDAYAGNVKDNCIAAAKTQYGM